jgi:hypothetical protein
MLYAIAPFLGKSPGAAFMRQAAERGEVVLVQRRVDGGNFQYEARRRASPRKAARSLPQIEGDSQGDGIKILAILRVAVEMGEPCPTNATIARLAQLPDRYAAAYALRKLDTAGRIRSYPGLHAARVIEVVGLGCTADIDDGRAGPVLALAGRAPEAPQPQLF